MSHITTEDPATTPALRNSLTVLATWPLTSCWDIGALLSLKFYTDVLGLPGTYGGIIFLISNSLLRFTDMGTGIMLDSRRKIGQKWSCPFILYASFGHLTGDRQLCRHRLMSPVKTVMATILFMLYGLFSNCSYGAIVPAITKNPNERASLAAWRQGGATAGLLLCTVSSCQL